MRLSPIFFIFLCLFCINPLFAETLIERLHQCKKGDYVFLHTETHFTALILAETIEEGKALKLIEIEVPYYIGKNFLGQYANWKAYLEDKAPGSKIIRKQLSTPSISVPQDPIQRLLFLPLTKAPSGKLRKIGSLSESMEDTRPLWLPPLHLAGKKISHPKYDILFSQWPKEDSLLSGAEIFFYFPSNPKLFFPSWIEVRTTHFTKNFGLVDCGSELNIPALWISP
jgi:hypothetical protein